VTGGAHESSDWVIRPFNAMTEVRHGAILGI
jgi:hypothetical protein